MQYPNAFKCLTRVQFHSNQERFNDLDERVQGKSLKGSFLGSKMDSFFGGEAWPRPRRGLAEASPRPGRGLALEAKRIGTDHGDSKLYNTIVRVPAGLNPK